MANERSSFYRRVLEQLLDEGVLRREMSAFHALGFEHVTISNVDEDVAEKPRLPHDLQEWMQVEEEELRPDRGVVGRRYEVSE